MLKLKLLVVDDAKFIRDLVQRTLRTQYPEIEITEAENGRKAQASLERFSYDMILCDWEMPEMDGLELLQWIRNNEKISALPFILITSLDQKENVIEASKAGVNDYITKPFSSEQLISKVIKQLIKTGRLTQEQANSMGRKERITSVGSAELLTGSSPLLASKPTRKGPLGKALLLAGETRQGVIIQDLSTTEATLFGKLSDGQLNLTQEVILGLVAGAGETALKLPVKAYIIALELAERQQNSDKVKIRLQFLPQDATTNDKFKQILNQLLAN